MPYRRSCFVRTIGADVWAVLMNRGTLSAAEVDDAVAVVMGVLARYHGQTIYNDPGARVEPLEGEALIAHLGASS